MEDVIDNNKMEQGLDKKSRNRMWLIYGGRLVLLTLTLNIDLLSLMAGVESGLSLMFGLLLSIIYTVVVLGVNSGSSAVRKSAAVFSVIWTIWSALSVISSIGYIESMVLSAIELAFAALTAFTLIIDKRTNAYLDTKVKVKENGLFESDKAEEVS